MHAASGLGAPLAWQKTVQLLHTWAQLLLSSATAASCLYTRCPLSHLIANEKYELEELITPYSYPSTPSRASRKLLEMPI
jgi:hypothetical protein